MPPTAREQIEAIIARGEPIDFPALLVWREPPRDAGAARRLERMLPRESPEEAARRENFERFDNAMQRGEPIDWAEFLVAPEPRSASRAVRRLARILPKQSKKEKEAVEAEIEEETSRFLKMSPEEREKYFADMERENEEELKRLKNWDAEHDAWNVEFKAWAAREKAAGAPTGTPSPESPELPEEPFWLSKKPRIDTPKIPVIETNLEREQELTEAEWDRIATFLADNQSLVANLATLSGTVDWRSVLPARGYFTRLSPFNIAAHDAVKLLLLAALHDTLRAEGRVWANYVRAACCIALGAESFGLLITHMTMCAAVSQILSLVQYIVARHAQIGEVGPGALDCLASLDPVPGIERSLIGERVFGLDATRREVRRADKQRPWWEQLGKKPGIRAAEYLDYLGGMIAASRVPPLQLPAQLKSVEERVGQYSEYDGGLLMPGSLLSPCLITAQLRVAMLEIKCKLALAGGGDELLPKSERPQDPIDGSTLEMEAVEGGTRIFSRGCETLQRELGPQAGAQVCCNTSVVVGR